MPQAHNLACDASLLGFYRCSVMPHHAAGTLPVSDFARRVMIELFSWRRHCADSGLRTVFRTAVEFVDSGSCQQYVTVFSDGSGVLSVASVHSREIKAIRVVSLNSLED